MEFFFKIARIFLVWQLSLFKQNALREQGLMMKIVGKQLVASLEEYNAHIQYQILLKNQMTLKFLISEQ